MNIIILMGSPNANGSTSILVERFRAGAMEVGHTVEVIDVTRRDVAPCTGCVSCGYEGTCVLADDMDAIRRAILAADMLVFATPLYYYGMSAQLKTVIDRFCAFNGSLSRKRMRSALLTVAWNADSWTFDALEAHYRTLVHYLSLKDAGMVLGRGCGTPAMTRATKYPDQAYRLGKSLV